MTLLEVLTDEQLSEAYARCHRTWRQAMQEEQAVFKEMERRGMIDERGLPKNP